MVRATCLGTKRDFLIQELCFQEHLQLSISNTSHQGHLWALLFAVKGAADVIERLLIEKNRKIHLNQTWRLLAEGLSWLVVILKSSYLEGRS